MEESRVPNTEAGQVAHCSRCGVRCRVAADRNDKARLLMNADRAQGWCCNCAATDFLKNTEPLGMLIERGGPEMLRLGHIQEQFGQIMVAGGADVNPPEIDWDEVIANWGLPFEEKPRGKGRKKRA